MDDSRLTLRVSLPHQLLLQLSDVRRVIVETASGQYGLYPHRLDCVTALVPGILFCESASEGDVYVAVDEGVLVKTNALVSVSVGRAVTKGSLTRLRAAVHEEFLALDAEERSVRQILRALETSLLKGFGELGHD